MLKIRLKRFGKRNAPSYRIIVIDSREPRDGQAIEEIGWYNPAADPKHVEYDKERLAYWQGCGAQLTPAVDKLIKGEYEYVPYHGASKETAEESGEVAAEEPTEETSEEKTAEPEATTEENTATN